MRRLLVFGLATAGLLPAQVAGWHRLPILASLTTKKLGFDDRRGRLILFESSERAAVSATWEWVGNTWSLRRTATTPPPRQGFAAGYDPMRHRFVLFGGADDYYYAQRADTWEYDGLDWRQANPPVSPPAQYGGWLGFDHANGVLLLCAGAAPTGSPGGWHFDGTTWSATAPAPFNTGFAALASDPIRQRVVALVANGPVSETFEWDGSSWLRQTPALQPPARHRAAATWHARHRTVFVHGGYTTTPPHSYYTDLWQWDGTTWAQVYVYPPQIPERADHALEYDRASQAVVAVGGFEPTGAATDTLRFDGALWHRYGAGTGWGLYTSTAYDPVRDRLQVIADQPRPRGHEWDGARWSPMALPPGMRTCQGLAHDTVRGVTVAVGLLGSVLHTWERNGTTWSQAIPTPALPATNRLVWHGGLGQVLSLSHAVTGPASLLAWNGAQWLPVANSAGAPSGMGTPVYDAARNELVVPHFTGNVLTVEVWTPAGWSQRTPTASPPRRYTYLQLTLGYDDSRQRVVLFGGRDPTYGPTPGSFHRYFADLWEWDGATWSQRMLPNAPPGRDGATLAFDPVRQRLLLIGGERSEWNGALLRFADVWALDATPPPNVTVIGAGCGGAGGVPQLTPSSPHDGAEAFAVDLQSAPANAPCLLAFGAASPPVALGAGCAGHLTPAHVSFGVTGTTGFASRHTAIPLGLIGLTFAVQAAVLDPSAPLGVALTPALDVTVGH